MKSLVFVAMLAFSGQSALAQGNVCSPLIPVGGAFKVITSDGSTHHTSSAKDWFCSDNFEDSANNSSLTGKVTIPIDGIPVGAAFDSKNAAHRQARKKFCSSSARDFTDQEKSFLTIKQGDPVLVKGYVDCIGAQSFLSIDTVSRPSGAFDVRISSKPYPGGKPLLISAKVLAGATPTDTDSFVSGARIPFSNSGTEPLEGTYAFSPGIGEADVRIRTSIGSKTVTARRCPMPNVGTWTAEANMSRVTTSNYGTFSHSESVSSASCHPHCENGVGDDHTLVLIAPVDSTLSNGKYSCDGEGCAYAQIGSMSRVAANRYELAFKSRGSGVTVTMTADRQDRTEVVQREITAKGSIKYGIPFAVEAYIGGSSSIVLNTNLGKVSLTPASIMSGNIPDWLKQATDVQQTNSTRVFTLQVNAPWCPITTQ